ncbi:hypothetical protein [Actinokineospora enzanensis]|uniref:hypothetical protein n=1 Tax=Actinokineospora enzanensis TaxID=155975 RepID=UPI000372120C|nr:hypothetical protein [Actinokineospora enzanensis]
MRSATRTAGLRIATRDWRTAVSTQARSAVDGETWTALVTGDPAAACTRFAQLANSLLDEELGQELVDRLLDQAAGDGAVARAVAGQVTRRLAEVGAAQADIVADSLRVLGVHTCAIRDRDLADCRCLRDLIEAHGLAATKQKLQDGLSALLPAR